MSQKVGVAWYSRDTWVRLSQLAPDPDDLEDTYEDWLRMWHEASARLRQAGINPDRVEVDFEAFRDWCATHGFSLDSAARAQFVSEELQRRDRDPGVRGLEP